MGLFSSKKKSSNEGLTAHLADLALVLGAVIALARRQGLISGSTARRLTNTSKDASVSPMQLVVVGSAALRLLRWFRSSRK